MFKKYFFEGSLNNWLGTMLLLLFGTSFTSFALYGPYFSPDTINYFNFSKTLFLNDLWTAVYSPFYPFILHCLTLFPSLSLFHAASLLIIIQYGFGLYFLCHFSKITMVYYRFNLKKSTTFILLTLIVYHSWWSFRIISWAHADATFYTLLIIWSYFLTEYIIKSSLRSLLIFSLLSATLIWIKLNALALLPFFLVLILVDKNKKRWLFPLFITSASYWCYQFLFPKNLLESHMKDILYNSYFYLEGLEILWINLAELCKVTLGFFLSDVLTSYIPHLISLLGGIFILAFLTFLVIREIIKGLILSSFFLLFGWVYLLCLLFFQQMTFFEEINYRTLFPFFISCSWYLWAKLLILRKNSLILILVLGFLMTSHTVLGHLWLWKRQDVNSLFEVERLMKSGMVKKIQLLQNPVPFRKVLFITDHPEKLSMLLDDPFVVHYDPDAHFINGKRRPVNTQERQRNLDLNKEKLLNGEAVLILFGEDERLIDFAKKNGLYLLDDPEWLIISAPLNADTIKVQE